MQERNVKRAKFRIVSPVPDKMKGEESNGGGPMDPKSPVIHAELDASVNKLNGRFDTTDEKLNSLNKSVDSLHQDIREIRTWLIGGIAVGVLLAVVSIVVSLIVK